MQLSGKRVVVAGMARSGVSAVELLLKKGAHVTAVDSSRPDELQGAALKLESWGVPLLPQGPGSFADAEIIVLSPGVPADLSGINAARARGVPVIGEVELAGYFLRGSIAGITGSNGKTTTTALTGHILRQSGILCQVGGNIGTAPTAMVETSRDGQWNVLELSSFQTETISEFHADIAVALNVTPDHLDRHYTFENYAAAKGRLFETQRPGSFAVLNADDPTTLLYAQRTAAQTIWFSLSRPVTPGVFLEHEIIYFDSAILMEARDIPLRGLHNVENAMAAAAVARLAGAPIDKIAAAVRSFPGVEHRLEFVREIGGVRYYNDSKATNVDATLKALAAFPGGIWLILGGKDKESDYTPLRGPIAKRGRGVLLIGAAAEKIGRQINDGIPMEHCGTLDRAVLAARRQAEPGDTVLLAPACASFDQFENFEHRGRVFKTAVMAL